MSIKVLHLPEVGSIWVARTEQGTLRYAVVTTLSEPFKEGLEWGVSFKRIATYDDRVDEMTWNVSEFYKVFTIIG